MRTRILLSALAAAGALVACSGDDPAPPAPSAEPGAAAACARLEQVRGEAAAVEQQISALQGALQSRQQAGPSGPPDPALEGQRQSLLSRQAQLRGQESQLAAECGR